MAIICAKCKNPTMSAKSIRLRSSDDGGRGVCTPCFDRLMAWRAKRGLDRHLRKVGK